MNNGAAIGYMILAAREWLNLDDEFIIKLEDAMYKSMDKYTENEAERAYLNN